MTNNSAHFYFKKRNLDEIPSSQSTAVELEETHLGPIPHFADSRTVSKVGKLTEFFIFRVGSYFEITCVLLCELISEIFPILFKIFVKLKFLLFHSQYQKLPNRAIVAKLNTAYKAHTKLINI